MTAMMTRDDAGYAFDLVRRICSEVGPGLPGTSQERERAAIIERELRSHLGSGNVAVEEFSLAPGAFLGSLPLGALLALVAVLLNLSVGRLAGVPAWLAAVAALAFCLASIVTVVLEFFLYVELLDPFFERGRSVNVAGVLRRPGTEEVSRMLILSGHHDSAPENTWLRYLGYGFYAAIATMAVGSAVLLAMCAIQMVGLVAGDAGLVRAGTLGWALLAYPILPSLVFSFFYSRRGKDGGTVPGAADNLSASALVVAMARFLAAHPEELPADTELRFVSFGSEEAGLRGSRRYVARHLEELKRLDARLLNFETVAHPEITILSSDMNRSVGHSPEMVKSAVAAAERAGVPYRARPASMGEGTDAGPFSQASLKATTLLPFQVPQQMVAFYHQKWDTPEVLTVEPLLNVLKLALEWVRNGGEQAKQPGERKP